MNRLIFACATAAAVLSAVPAAAITNFASFSALSNSPNIGFTAGSGGSGSVASLEGAPVTFRFLDALGTTSVFDTTAIFSFMTNTLPGTIVGKTAIASTTGGTISFTAKNPVSYLGRTGTNLLTATFNEGTFTGVVGGSVASFFASQPPSSVTFTSDFLKFGKTTERDIAVAIDAINPKIGLGKRGLGNFTGSAGGLFGVDGVGGSPSPVPEPAAWGMLVAGFGLVGTMTRRRSRLSVAA